MSTEKLIPGTSIEASAEGAKEVRQALRRQCGGCCSLFFLCLLVPLAIATGLFVIILGVAFLAFSIQALVVGSDTINDPTLTECRFISQWLLVFGSLTVGGCLLTCCAEAVRSKTTDPTPLQSCWFAVPRLLHLVTLGWVICGLVVTYNPGSYPSCSPSLYQVFQVMVNFLFWGTVALMSAALVVSCLMVPIFMMFRKKNDKKNEEKTAEEQQKLLEKA